MSSHCRCPLSEHYRIGVLFTDKPVTALRSFTILMISGVYPEKDMV